MKRFTILFTLVGALAFLAMFQVWSVARAESSAVIAPASESNGALSDAVIPEAAASYKAVLGKSLKDEEFADFVASNNCSSAGQFQLCQDAGVALWLDADQKVNTVYLYTVGANGFAAYEGTLPQGLVSNDTMAAVEEKFGQPFVPGVPQAGRKPGLPDRGGSPDHIHYWAVYERFGLTIIYNTPFANDKNATIDAILISE